MNTQIVNQNNNNAGNNSSVGIHNMRIQGHNPIANNSSNLYNANINVINNHANGGGNGSIANNNNSSNGNNNNNPQFRERGQARRYTGPNFSNTAYNFNKNNSNNHSKNSSKFN